MNLIDAVLTIPPGISHEVKLTLTNPGRKSVRARVVVQAEDGQSPITVITAPYESLSECHGRKRIIAGGDWKAGLSELRGVR